jgi:hypothetical protein
MSIMRQLLLYTGAVALLGGTFWFGADYRRSAQEMRHLLPVVFEHRDHTATECFECHHNFIDGTGSGTCYSCHKYDMTIAYQMEDMFHTLCRDCHTEERKMGEEAGPVRSCDGCHLVESFADKN